MRRIQSEQLYKEALQHIVGGVNSPSRSFQAVGGGAPVFMKRAEGAYFWDEDGNRYIDFLGAYGPIILGHAHPAITAAIEQAAHSGVLFGTPTKWETGQSPIRQFRHGSGHVRHSGRSRLHGTNEVDQVRRMLPRPFRSGARRRRFGTGYARNTRQRGHTGKNSAGSHHGTV